MARFYVGQRVRIARGWDLSGPNLDGVDNSLVGKEGIIVELVNPDEVWDEDQDVQCYDIDVTGNDEVGYFREDQLEPITDSYDLVSWESMRDLWVPEHLREDA